MSTGIQTTPVEPAGTVLIVLRDGKIAEVVSDLQLDVQVTCTSWCEGAYESFPSRPLWEFVRKATVALLERTTPDAAR
jgi:hypothetical protein